MFKIIKRLKGLVVPISRNPPFTDFFLFKNAPFSAEVMEAIVKTKQFKLEKQRFLPH